MKPRWFVCGNGGATYEVSITTLAKIHFGLEDYKLQNLPLEVVIKGCAYDPFAKGHFGGGENFMLFWINCKVIQLIEVLDSYVREGLT